MPGKAAGGVRRWRAGGSDLGSMDLDGPCPVMSPRHLRLRRRPRSSWVLLAARGNLGHLDMVVAVSSVGGGRPTVVDLADDEFERRGTR
jgi:hypothetical protein